MLAKFGERYRCDLTERVIPFWLKNSLDRECGGYFSCLDQDGAVYDTKKYMWLQGREVWMFARLYNEFEKRQEFLDAAALGLGEFGGLFYFMDVEGKPTLQLESSMKLWWPHTEALYALVLAHSITGEGRWLEWLERVDEYAYDHFVDEEYGGWFGYCDRRGELTHTCKGGNYKGFFHVPRALLMCVQQIEKAERGG